MVEDKLLVWRFRHGSRDVLRRIYEKYKNDLLALAIVLLNNKSTAEDVVHDVFVSFAEHAERIRQGASLKSYLLTCVANRARNLNQAKVQQTIQLGEEASMESHSNRPDQLIALTEKAQRIWEAVACLPTEQKWVVIMHLQGGLRFKEIARSQGVSLNTIQSRYRYALDKLRSCLDDEVEK